MNPSTYAGHLASAHRGASAAAARQAANLPHNFSEGHLLHGLAEQPAELLHVLLLQHLARSPAEAARQALGADLARADVGRVLQPVEEALQLEHMAQALPLLDAAPFVERYAWMAAHDCETRLKDSTRAPSHRGLVEVANGTVRLTDLGRLYQSG